MRCWSEVLCIALAGLLACSGSSRRPAAGGLTPPSQEPDIGLHELRKSLESTVLENYAQLTYGNLEALLDGVAMEREVQIVGVTPKDVVIGTNPQGLHSDRRLYQQRSPRILSKNLDVQLSQDGSVGWVFDEISYRVRYMGREASIPIRSTAVYVRDLERWVMVAEHLSYGVPIPEIVGLAAREDLAVGSNFETDYGASRQLAARLVGLIGRFINDGSEVAVVLGAENSLILLPGPEQEVHGGGATATISPLGGAFGERATVAVRKFRVQLASSRRVAWLVTQLVVRTEFNGDRLEIALRGTFVLERGREEDWTIMQAHISAPLQERQLSERVFGPIEE